MKKKTDTLLRQWMILKNIPLFPRKVSAAELTERVRSEGFDITKRTMERNLQSLSLAFPIQSDERSLPYGWSWSRDADTFTFPAMSPVQALTLSLAKDHLASILPSSLMQTLAPYFQCADNVLMSGESVRNMADWREKVAIVPSSQALIPPPYDEEVVEIVHAALLAEKQLEIDYASRSSPSWVHAIHPLGLVQRGPVIYLVAAIYDADIRILALHRIRWARMLDMPANVPEDFCLARYIAGGAFGFSSGGEKIRLVARFTAAAAAHLRETALSEDQELTEEGDTVCVRATVIDSPQLCWWLKGFGDQVEVLEPADLREEFAQMAFSLQKKYQG